MSTLAWHPLTEDDLDALRHLARRCLDADGGLPQLAHEPMIRRLFLSGSGIGGPRRDRRPRGRRVGVPRRLGPPDGDRARAPVRPPAGAAARRSSQWCRERSGGALLRVVAETTSPESDALFAAARPAAHLRRARHAPPARRDPPDPRPEGLTVAAVDDDTATLFYTAYRLSFADRPGFPDPPRDEWVGEVSEDPGFRAGASRVVLDERGEPVGVRDPHRRLARPGRSGARVARPRARGAPRGPLAAGAASRRAATRPGSRSTSTTRRTTSTCGSASRNTACGPATAVGSAVDAAAGADRVERGA